MRYEEPLFRPPSEAESLIIQTTIGCSHNRCTFCSMYKGKKFRVRSFEDIAADIEEAARRGDPAERIFLADGNSLCMPSADLLKIFGSIREKIPRCRRITLYGGPRDVLAKSPEELTMLHEAGLKMVYLGIESGSDTILRDISKGVTAEEISNAGKKLHKSGIKLSVTLISGLGGKELWEEHARESARIVNRIQPHYLSLLTLMTVPGTELHTDIQEGRFQPLSPREVLEETRLFISMLEQHSSLFRSNHASNYLPLGGRLPQDKEKLLEMLDEALTGGRTLRPESWRGL